MNLNHLGIQVPPNERNNYFRLSSPKLLHFIKLWYIFCFDYVIVQNFGQQLLFLKVLYK